MNLLEETKEILKENGHSLSEVLWVGTQYAEIPIHSFLVLADTEYDSGYGLAEVAVDLVVCGENWWLERWEYDGAEGWAYKKLPHRPSVIIQPQKITGRDATLKRINPHCFRKDVQTVEEGLARSHDLPHGDWPPYQFPEAWCVETGLGTETGDLEYICSEFAQDGLVYHFESASTGIDHEHTFSGVLRAVMREPEGFSIHGFEEEYSQQEQRFLQKLRQKLIDEKRDSTK